MIVKTATVASTLKTEIEELLFEELLLEQLLLENMKQKNQPKKECN